MSVSPYYSAARATPLTAAEKAELERVETARPRSFPYDDEESVTELRRVLPDAEWDVAMDDWTVPWDEEEGYHPPD